MIKNDQGEEYEASGPNRLFLVDGAEEGYGESASHREGEEAFRGGGAAEVDFFGVFHMRV
jgi:hypothetical protein